MRRTLITAVFTLFVCPILAGTVRAQPVTVIPNATTVAVNNGPGNQTDPHISGTLVTYTSAYTGASQVRYFDLATGVDQGIPTQPGAYDFLPQVSGTTIVFTRVETGRQSIWAFDAAAGGDPYELNPLAVSNRRGASIGGRTVAWQDLGLGFTTYGTPLSEIVVYDFGTATTVRLTDDEFWDRIPAVSPDGNVIAWEKCWYATAPCDIYQAVKGADGIWTTRQVTSTSDPESSADASATLVVYGGNRAGNPTGPDIYWTPVGGGSEQQLALAGEQRNPNISGNLLVFESRYATDSLPNWDIFAYDLSTQILYRVTDTASLDETLNGVSVVGDQAHLVYSVLEDDQNIYAQTFTLLPGRYDFTGTGGFQSPIANPPVVNVVSAGRAIPIKWQLRDASGAYITDVAVVSGVLVQPVSCGTLTLGLDNAVPAEGSGASGLHYDGATNQFIFNWKTSSAMAGGCYAFVLQLNDGSQYPANFRLR